MRIVFHIGLHKTASTWFQSFYFEQHPDIKIINDYYKPWDDPIINYLVLQTNNFNATTYRKIVKERVQKYGLENYKGILIISAERLSGHPFSNGFDREIIAKNIKKAYPDSKIILFIRNQIDIIDSTYQQLVKEGYQGNINDFLSNKYWKKPFFSIDYFDYYNLYRLYSSTFGIKCIKIFLYEDIVSNRNRLLEDLCNFLEIKLFVPDENKRKNKRTSRRNIKAKSITNRFRLSEYNEFPVIKIKNKIFLQILSVLISLFVTDRNIQLSAVNKKKIKEYFYFTNKLFFESCINNDVNNDKYGV